MRFLKLGTAGLRGEIGTGLTPRLAMDFSLALGTYIEGGRVVIARDTRFSSLMLRHAAVAALTSCGCEVSDLGVRPAPTLHCAVPILEADAGLLLGGGHHPAGWNALVPFDETGRAFNSVRMQELLDVYHSRRYRTRKWSEIGVARTVDAGMDDRYLDRVCGALHVQAIKSRRFKVVCDFCNGSGSETTKAFGERLGLDLVPINDIFSGVLPHDPEPRPRSAFQVQSIMKALDADVGFVFNSDLTRTSVVTRRGETLSEEYTAPLVADQVLRHAEEGSVVVTNPCTTRTLDEIVSKHGGALVKTMVGEAPVIDRMWETNAILGAEGSGSVVARAGVPGFDGLMAMGFILDAMADRQADSAELVDELPRYHIVKRTVNMPSAHAYSLLHGMKNHFPDAVVSETDGFRFDWPQGWVHLRASMTEPIVRTIVEWQTKEEAEERAVQLRGLLERLVAS